MATPQRIQSLAKRVFPKMQETMAEVDDVANRLRAAGTPLAIEELSTIHPPGAAGGTEEMAPPPEEELYGVPRTEVLERHLREGAVALDKTRTGSELTVSEEKGLEAIVHLFGRPALLVQDDDFGAPPDEWAHLEQKRPMLRAILPSIGRIELRNHHTYPWVGTGFLVGDGLLMTNRHVAEVFAVKAGASWKFTSGVTARVDYKEEYQRDVSREFKVTQILGIHQKYDLALLKVAMKSSGTRSPAPLPIASSKPKATKDGDVVVVGYPAYDSRNGHTEMLEIFKNIFNVKRLQPGKSTGVKKDGAQSILGHDCSTLGGNSGSCVIDLESGKVIGLHFGGQYLVGNVSVPLWAMTKDPMLKKQKVNWQ